MDDSTSHDDRTEAFQIARRGYDRRQVDAYRESNESRIEVLERHIQSLEDSMSELGLARPADLAAELDVVGEEVKRILQEARVAAEQMRSRAADDAARWRAEADEESRSLRESARVVAYETRRSAWENGSEMLASAVAASEAATIAATERALFTQAEAEREASRLVGDARRERDESVGGARDEAERLVTAARQESDSIMAAARRQADAAQERASALELRRAELMAELETARATIAGSEVVSAPDVVPEDLSVEPADDATPAEPAEDMRTHWPDDAGSVKIVSAARVMSTEPVDADAMVAEIEAMRESSELRAASYEPEDPSVTPREDREEPEELPGEDAGGQEGDQLAATSLQPEPEPEPEPESSSSPSGGGVAEGDGGGQESPEPPAVRYELEPVPVPAAEGRGDAGERSDDAGGQESDQLPATTPQPEPAVDPEPKPDPLAGLFAQLKDPAEGDGGGQESPEPPAASPQPEPIPVPPTEARGDAEERSDGAGGQESPEPEPEPEPSFDPFALRERHLLRVQNRALRSVKRSLVEAQNQALEDLRLIDGWEPDERIVTDEVSEALSTLARESMVEGFAAAAEMMHTDETPQPDDVDPGDPSPEFAGALIEAAHGAVTRSRGSGAGHREIASALSRVFRSWRTDEAERRVQFASRAAYHVGVTAALADLGATELEVKSSGRPCRECPANKGPWAIADGLPSGTVMPPARLECACTIVPSL